MTPARWTSARAIATAVNAGRISAREVVEATLSRIEADNARLNAFTAVTPDRARATAARLDEQRTSSGAHLPLAGVPFAVKNLFDVAGLPTLAGSRINRDRPPAARDAVLVERLEAAGAILVGALNMGEYAYDFTGENIHDGPSRNPHDTNRMTGGSSGGSGGAVAAGLVPLSLGSDTNGSIRVPSSFCGLFGLKPTFGRLPRTRSFPFVANLDHLGPIARTAEDLALSYDAMQGPDAEDPACSLRPASPTLPTLEQGIGGLRIAVADGYFKKGAGPEALAAVETVARALKATREVEFPHAHIARAAAYVITASEGASLHLQRLRQRPDDFDPAVRDRLLAGAMIPATAVIKAQKVRRWVRDEVLESFRDVDALLAPSTPCTAPRIGETMLDLGGERVPLRPNIGVFTQPISCIGLPVVAVPVPLQPLPIGVQIVCAPGREDIALRVAHHLEREGVCRAPEPATWEA
jgi:aspartyl-tRNA(Asn)/glutamyl-tRNA(Gln) amidotransferase subunit A